MDRIQYLIAHPNSLILLPTKEAARERAHAFRQKRAIRIYEVREIEYLFPSDPSGPEPARARAAKKAVAK